MNNKDIKIVIKKMRWDQSLNIIDIEEDKKIEVSEKVLKKI
jgi:hypothetical protein